MWQAHKGRATIFRADRRFTLTGGLYSLTVDATLNFNWEAELPTPAQIYESLLLAFPSAAAKQDTVSIILFDFISEALLTTTFELSADSFLAFYSSFLSRIRAPPFTEKGLGFAAKGTNILEHRARLWAALSPPSVSLLAEAYLALDSLAVPETHVETALSCVLGTGSRERLYLEYTIPYLTRLLYKSIFMLQSAVPLPILLRFLILQSEKASLKFLFLSSAIIKLISKKISEIEALLNIKSALISEEKLAESIPINLLFSLHRQWSLTTSARLKLETLVLEDVLSSANLPILFSTEVILPIIPGFAIYSIPLKCKFESQSNLFAAAEVMAAFGKEIETSFIQLLELLMKVIPDLERSICFNFPIFLKNQIFIPINFVFIENLFSELLAEAHIPGLYTLSGEALLKALFNYNLLFEDTHTGILLTKVISKIKTFSSFIYSIPISLETEVPLGFHAVVSKALLINTFLHSTLSSIIAQNLIFKILFEKASVHEIIENILVSLKPAPAFSFGSDFSVSLLACFTSSLPIYTLPLPFGGLFFTDLSRIYNYRISNLERL